jgi:hypothetical protein
VACTSGSECVAIDAENQAVVGDPNSSTAWTVEPIPRAGGLTGVACPSTSECVTVDKRGQENTGTDSVPVNTSSPTAAGTEIQGQTLTESHGSWTYSPIRYIYQWEDCDSAGTSCAPISGATSQTYLLGPRDVGHAIRVLETAINDVGDSNPASSAPTGVVATSVGELVVYSGKPSGHNIREQVGCRGISGQSCRITAALSVIEKLRKGHVDAVAATAHRRRRPSRRTVSLGAKTVTLKAGSRLTITLKLNRIGKTLLRRFKHLRVAVTTTQAQSKRRFKRTITVPQKPNHKPKHKHA